MPSLGKPGGGKGGMLGCICGGGNWSGGLPNMAAMAAAMSCVGGIPGNPGGGSPKGGGPIPRGGMETDEGGILGAGERERERERERAFTYAYISIT